MSQRSSSSDLGAAGGNANSTYTTHGHANPAYEFPDGSTSTDDTGETTSTSNGSKGVPRVPSGRSSPRNGSRPVSMEDTAAEGIMHIKRPIYTQVEFESQYVHHSRPRKTIRNRLRQSVSRCTCTKAAKQIFPLLNNFEDYSIRQDLLQDILAGLTIGVMHIPQGMAYGILAELPPVYGLYVSFFPVLIYFFFGTSRHISIGTFAVVSLMIGSAVLNADCSSSVSSLAHNNNTMAENASVLSPDGSEETGESDDVIRCKLEVATTLTFIAGLIQALMGIFRLGFVTIYLSEPLTRGFTTASALYVFSSQIKHVFGLRISNESGILALIFFYKNFFLEIHNTNIAALVMSVTCIVIMFLIKQYVNPKVKAKIRVPIPIELIVVVVTTLISAYGKFESRFDVPVVGKIPGGIPAPRNIAWSRFGDYVTDAFAVAIVAFASNFAMGKLFAGKHSYEISSNQELLAAGVCNMGSSFFNCFVSSASLSRSLVQEGAGGRTQIAGLTSCALLLIVFYGVGPLFQQLPNCILAAIVIVNLKGMFMQLRDLKKYWGISKYDFCIWVVMFLSVFFLNVALGLLVGVVFALLTVLYRSQSPYTCVMGRIPHTDIYKDVSVYTGALEVPGVKIFRFESSLYYANSEHFRNKLYEKSLVNPREIFQKRTKIEKKRADYERKMQQQGDCCRNGKKRAKDVDVEVDLDAMFQLPDPEILHIIIDCTTMSYIDAVGISMLRQVMMDYNKINMHVYLAGCKAGVREQLKCGKFFETISESYLYLTSHDALLAAYAKDERLQRKVELTVPSILHMDSVFVRQHHNEKLEITHI